MTTLTVNIENEKDLPVLQEILDRFGLSYSVSDAYDEALEASLKRGLEDIAAGRVYSHEEVMASVKARYNL
jgi:predicted transcriptional regulator